MNAPEKITVQLSDGSAIEMRRLSKAELIEFYGVVEQHRIKTKGGAGPKTPDEAAMENLLLLPWVIARATGNSQEWVNQLPQSDVWKLIDGVEMLLADLLRQEAARRNALEQTISNQKYG